MVMQVAPGPPVAVHLRSSALCLEALAAYDRLFRRSGLMEPDAGTAQRYASGRRNLVARAGADSWTVTGVRADRAALLLHMVDDTSDDCVDDWIDRFPQAFLATIDRRQPLPVPHHGEGRRFADRIREPACVDRIGSESRR